MNNIDIDDAEHQAHELARKIATCIRAGDFVDHYLLAPKNFHATTGNPKRIVTLVQQGLDDLLCEYLMDDSTTSFVEKTTQMKWLEDHLQLDIVEETFQNLTQRWRPRSNRRSLAQFGEDVRNTFHSGPHDELHGVIHPRKKYYDADVFLTNNNVHFRQWGGFPQPLDSSNPYVSPDPTTIHKQHEEWNIFWFDQETAEYAFDTHKKLDQIRKAYSLMNMERHFDATVHVITEGKWPDLPDKPNLLPPNSISMYTDEQKRHLHRILWLSQINGEQIINKLLNDDLFQQKWEPLVIERLCQTMKLHMLQAPKNVLGCMAERIEQHRANKAQNTQQTPLFVWK